MIVVFDRQFFILVSPLPSSSVAVPITAVPVVCVSYHSTLIADSCFVTVVCFVAPSTVDALAVMDWFWRRWRCEAFALEAMEVGGIRVGVWQR